MNDGIGQGFIFPVPFVVGRGRFKVGQGFRCHFRRFLRVSLLKTHFVEEVGNRGAGMSLPPMMLLMKMIVPDTSNQPNVLIPIRISSFLEVEDS